MNYRGFKERCFAVGLLIFLTLTALGCGVWSWMSSPYEKEIIAPILFIVAFGLLLTSIFACSKLRAPDSAFWKS